MKCEKKDMRILMKDNTLVKTKYELNLAENRLYNLILYKFQKDGQLLKCILSQDEIKEVIKFKSANTVKGILDLLNKLSNFVERYVFIHKFLYSLQINDR